MVSKRRANERSDVWTKKITVISTSIRPNSNSELLAKSFVEGAEAAGNDVTFITLKDKDIRFCRGCLSCHQTGKCIIQDDVARSWTLCFTQTWWSGYADLLFRDVRTDENPHRPHESNVSNGLPVPGRVLLATAADEGEDVFEKAETGLTGWLDCFPKTTLKGSVYCGGVTGGGEISGNAKLAEARALGAQV